jgi:hypothetical protein
MTLLYRLAEWHALAKLRMHTDSTLSTFDSVTTKLGQVLRSFRDTTCANFDTVELPREAAARGRKQRKAQNKNTSTSDACPAPLDPNLTPGLTNLNAVDPVPIPVNPVLSNDPPSEPSVRATKVRKTKRLNLSTYKFHALADYVPTIRMFGTTDSYSTQTVGLQHTFNL